MQTGRLQTGRRRKLHFAINESHGAKQQQNSLEIVGCVLGKLGGAGVRRGVSSAKAITNPGWDRADERGVNRPRADR